jgi:DNA-binding protein H-NS
MSTSDDRLAAIENIYKDALENEPHDLAAAMSVAQVTAIQSNVALARQAYYAAVSSSLTQDEQQVSAAYDAAVQAQAAVKAARNKSSQFADVINKVSAAAQSANNLLNAAKKG